MRTGFVSITAALAIMAVMATSFFTGVTVGRQGSQRDVIDGTPVPTDLQQPLSDLWQAYQHVNSDSFWRPFPNQKQLIYHAIEGMMAGVSSQDTHTMFYEPAINSTIIGSLNQTESYGIGATVMPTKLGLRISPRVGSTAQAAGLRDGDVITEVNGVDISHMAEQTAVAKIDGKQQGTTVTLTIVRTGVAHPFRVKVTRGVIPSVADGVIGSIGLIAFQGFDIDTAQEVHQNLQQLEARHISGLILDLRGNTGGYVDAAVSIASEFLPRGAVIYWQRGNAGNGKTVDTAFDVTKPGIAQRLPVVILTDGNTASAAEIVTAALRENNRATVIGTQTYGKGSEQENIVLADGSALRITTQLWLTPKKHWVQNTGITPDIQVAPSATGDAQLARALQYLTSTH